MIAGSMQRHVRQALVDILVAALMNWRSEPSIVNHTGCRNAIGEKMHQNPFSGYLGIDWSGARGARLSGLQLAMAKPGDTVPQSVTPPSGRHWGRDAVLRHLVGLATDSASGSVLVGIDFAFSHPFVDFGGYFPGARAAPGDAPGLWALVDTVNINEPGLYGGALFRHPQWGQYYLAPPDYDAPRYQSRRRITEHAARIAGRSPSPTFKAVGADNVCTGSLAGMRLLHHLKLLLGAKLAIWPFEAFVPGETRLVLVEVFPSFYFYRIGMVPTKRAAAEPAFLNAALAAYGSRGVAANFSPVGQDADEADAIIAAAALRYFARHGEMNLPLTVEDAAHREGWIFGVPAPNAEEITTAGLEQ